LSHVSILIETVINVTVNRVTARVYVAVVAAASALYMHYFFERRRMRESCHPTATANIALLHVQLELLR
jgi:hypothetical protein